MAVVPSQVAGAGLGGSFELKFLGSGCAACGVSGFLLLHIDPPKGQPQKDKTSNRGTANCSPWIIQLQTARGPSVRFSNWTRGQGALTIPQNFEHWSRKFCENLRAECAPREVKLMPPCVAVF
jgi:hypothetical protein